MEDKANSKISSEIKDSFHTDFPQYNQVFERLIEHPEFNDMLMDYLMCKRGLQKFSDLHDVEEIYHRLHGEIKGEIINYIINHI